MPPTNTNTQTNNSAEPPARSFEPQVVRPTIQPAGRQPAISATPAPIVQPIQPAASPPNETSPSLSTPSTASPTDLTLQSPTPQTSPMLPTEQPTATIVSGEPAVSEPPLVAASAKPKGRWRHKLAVTGLVIGGLLVLGGGSAAAYLGFILPNQPNQVLKTAIKNSLSQHQLVARGTIKATGGGSGTKVAVDADVSLQSDLDKHASATQITVTVDGVKLDGETRSMGGNLYVRVGDLTPLKTIAQAAAPDVASYVDSVNKVVGNQWILIDDTLLRSANLDCLSQFPDALSPQDINQLMSNYQHHAFASVSKVTRSATTYTYNFSVDNKKAGAYADSLSSLPIIKRVQACLDKGQTATDQPAGNPSNAFDTEINPSKVTNNGKTNVSLAVDKKTKLVSAIDIAPVTSTQDGTVTIHFGLGYSGVNIPTPGNAKSLPEVLASLQTIITGLVGKDNKLSLPVVKDAEREADINTLHAQLEAYYAQHKQYPTLTQLNDPIWRAANMPTLDKEVLRDPDSTSYTLVDRQTAHAYAYQPNSLGPPKQNANTSPNAPCDNKVKICVAYTLTAVHSDGTPYTQSSQ